MDLKTLPMYQRQAAAFIEARRALHLDFRMEADDAAAAAAAAEKAATDAAAAAAAKASEPAAGEDAVDENGVKLGFPAKTPVAEMNDKQQAAYWRNESKKQQRIAESRKDFDAMKADADKWRAHDREQQTPSQRAIEDARIEAKKEVAGDSALASLRAILSSRGKGTDELDGLLEFVSPDRFVTSEGKVDHQKVTAYADKLVPTGSTGGGGGYGQGRYQQTQTSRSAAGKAEAERRFGKK